jgi:hypothetical protein
MRERERAAGGERGAAQLMERALVAERLRRVLVAEWLWQERGAGSAEEVHRAAHPDPGAASPCHCAAATVLRSVVAAPLPEATGVLPLSSLPLRAPHLAFAPLPLTKPASVSRRAPDHGARPPGEPRPLPRRALPHPHHR